MIWTKGFEIRNKHVSVAMVRASRKEDPSGRAPNREIIIMEKKNTLKLRKVCWKIESEVSVLKHIRRKLRHVYYHGDRLLVHFICLLSASLMCMELSILPYLCWFDLFPFDIHLFALVIPSIVHLLFMVF